MPWDYNSLVAMQFKAEKVARLSFGHGQTIYADIRCQFELTSDVMRLIYLDSPGRGRLKNFAPHDLNQTKQFGYKLEKGCFECEEANVGHHNFQWRLTLSEWPFPDGLELPYVVPAVFFGHDQERVGGN